MLNSLLFTSKHFPALRPKPKLFSPLCCLGLQSQLHLLSGFQLSVGLRVSPPKGCSHVLIRGTTTSPWVWPTWCFEHWARLHLSLCPPVSLHFVCLVGSRVCSHTTPILACLLSGNGPGGLPSQRANRDLRLDTWSEAGKLTSKDKQPWRCLCKQQPACSRFWWPPARFNSRGPARRADRVTLEENLEICSHCWDSNANAFKKCWSNSLR